MKEIRRVGKITGKQYDFGVGVPVKSAEEVRLKLLKQNQLILNKKPVRKKDMVFFPIDNPVLIPDILEDMEFIIEKCAFKEKLKHMNISELLKNEFPKIDFKKNSFKYDQMGEIGVTKMDPTRTPLSFRRRVGDLILSRSPKLRTVINKADLITGTERVYPIEYLAGENLSYTWHQEYGIFIYFDLEKTYFNPRLAEEHNRVAMAGFPGEKILDLFCGVGPFSLHCAKRFPCDIIAVDINPYAIYALKRSIRRNKLQGDISVIIGDSLNIFRPNRNFNRIIMNLPQKAIEFLPYAISLLKKGGVITLYQFVSKTKNPEEEVERLIENKIGNVNSYKVLFTKVSREISPSKVQLNVDIKIN